MHTRLMGALGHQGCIPHSELSGGLVKGSRDDCNPYYACWSDGLAREQEYHAPAIHRDQAPAHLPSHALNLVPGQIK